MLYLIYISVYTDLENFIHILIAIPLRMRNSDYNHELALNIFKLECRVEKSEWNM